MPHQLPPMICQSFTLEFNDKGFRKTVKCVLAIDMATVRRQLGRKATKNGSKRARAGQLLVTLNGPVETIGAEEPQIGTVCYE